MAYSDYTFYSLEYYGDVLSDEIADKWLSRASDMLDNITFGRLDENFPTDEKSIVKVKKAVCAIADAMYRSDLITKSNDVRIDKDGTAKRAVVSVSSGRESISYAGGGATQYDSGASSANSLVAMCREIASTYIANVCDSEGTNLLYAGI